MLFEVVVPGRKMGFKNGYVSLFNHETRQDFTPLTKLLPEGMKLEVAYDSSEFINESISEVQETLLIAVALVVLVVLAFLKSFRATVIPTLAIPISGLINRGHL